MRIRIRHAMNYRYDRAVLVEPQTIRLRPRSDVAQTLLEHAIAITPEPIGRADLIELEGNDTLETWFNGLIAEMRIEATSLVETHRDNPYDFVLPDPEAARLPMQYDPPLGAALAAQRRRQFPDVSAVDELAREALARAGDQPLAFLLDVMAHLQGELDWIVRPEGDAWPPDRTLGEKRGSCRDLTVLFNEICRAAGLATRFVSGYHAGDPAGHDRELHAWSEVYLPGVGWRGFDPSNNLAADGSYVALAAAAIPELAAPVSGAWRGSGVSSSLEYEIAIQAEQ